MLAARTWTANMPAALAEARPVGVSSMAMQRSGGDAEALGGEEVDVGRGLGVRDLSGGDGGVEGVGEAEAAEQGVDPLRQGRRGDGDGDARAPEGGEQLADAGEGLVQVGELAAQLEVVGGDEGVEGAFEVEARAAR